MKQNLTLILMNEAVREGWREWMEKVRKVLPQTDAERPVTWIAAERLAQENGRMVRLVELLPPEGEELEIITRQIANAHTLFNVLCALVWLPLTGQMVRLVCALLPDKKRPQERL